MKDSLEGASRLGQLPEAPKLLTLKRPRLLEMLGSAPTAPSLMILHAPSGFGKTTLLEEWVSHLVARGITTRYLPVTEPNPGESPWQQFAEHLEVDGPGVDPHAAVRDWAVGLTEKTALVLDDYWLVTSVEFDREVAQLLKESPNLHLLIAAQRMFSFTNPLVTQPLTCVKVTQQDLAFTPGEVLELSKLHGVEDPDASQDLYDSFEGWPLGTLLALLALARGPGGQAMYEEFAAAAYSLLPEVIDRRILTAFTTVPSLDTAVLAGAPGADHGAADPFHAASDSGTNRSLCPHRVHLPHGFTGAGSTYCRNGNRGRAGVSPFRVSPGCCGDDAGKLGQCTLLGQLGRRKALRFVEGKPLLRLGPRTDCFFGCVARWDLGRTAKLRGSSLAQTWATRALRRRPWIPLLVRWDVWSSGQSLCMRKVGCVGASMGQRMRSNRCNGGSQSGPRGSQCPRSGRKRCWCRRQHWLFWLVNTGLRRSCWTRRTRGRAS